MTAERRVLVVDDEQDILEILTEVLVSHGFSVDTAIHGREARELVEENDYLFVLTDLQMPVMNGIELIEYLRRERPLLPVGVCSGRAKEFSEKLAWLSADVMISKPFNFDEIEHVAGKLKLLSEQREGLIPIEPKLTVRDLMATDVLTCHSSAPAYEAIQVRPYPVDSPTH